MNIQDGPCKDMDMFQMSCFIYTLYHNNVCLPLTIVVHRAVNVVSLCGSMETYPGTVKNMPHLKLKKYAFRNKVVENLANN
jgi:hypothetical protein